MTGKNRQTLHDALEAELAPVRLSEARRAAILAAAGGAGARRRDRRPWRVCLTAAALCAALAVTAVAASPSLREALAHMLGGFEPYAQEVEGVAATDQGIQLRVVSALSDGNKTVIYLEARDLEQERLGAQTTFQTLWVDRPEAAYVGGTFSSGQTVSYDAETHTALMRFSFTGDGPPASGGTLELGIRSFTPSLWMEEGSMPQELLTQDLLEVMELETGETVLVPEQTSAGLEGIQSGFLSAVGFGTDGRLHIQFRYGEGINAAESTLHLEVGSRSYEASDGGDQAAYDRLLRYFDMGEDGGETLFEYGGAWYQDTCYNIWPSDWEDVSLGGVSGRFNGGELIEGEWNLSIPLENVPHRRIPVGEYIGHIRLTYLDLTAMGMSVESDPGETPDTLGYPASLFFSDGTTLALGKPDTTSNGQGYSFNHWSTEAPIDPGQVVGVSIGMRYIPIQSGDTAGPGYWLAELPAQETESG